MGGGSARGLADVAVRFERLHHRVDVAGRERAVKLADDVGRVQVRVWLEQRRPDSAHTGQGPPAVVDAQLGHPRLRVEVRCERHRQLDRAGVAVDVQYELLDAARGREEGVDVLHGDAALGHPGGGVGDEPLERRDALDAPAHRLVHLGLVGERRDERIDLSGQQAIEEGDGRESRVPALFDPRQGRRGEQLRDERHQAALVDVGARRSHPWKADRSPASHASRSPGALRSQSGRISRLTARKSCQRSTIDGRPQNQ